MEIKNNQLTIKIPEGMEVDVEKSNLKAGVIKFRKKEICYADILSTLADKDVNLVDIKVPEMIVGKIIALDRLMTIAKYYNGDWKPDWNNKKNPKFYISFDTESSFYRVICGYIVSCHIVYFKNRKDAQAVIDNPNFRDILDTIYKD